jgi:hypothetical protein
MNRLARRLGAAPSSLGFGGPVARLARDADVSSFFLLPSSFIGLVRLPGVGFPSLTIWVPEVTLFAIANCNAPGMVAVRKHLPGEEPFCC